MFYDLIVCRSLTYAQRTVSVLERAGVRAFITRTPRSISKFGCGYSVKVPQGSLPAVLDILRRNDLPPKAVYFTDGLGSYRGTEP